jgi:hypothetical protein
LTIAAADNLIYFLDVLRLHFSVYGRPDIWCSKLVPARADQRGVPIALSRAPISLSIISFACRASCAPSAVLGLGFRSKNPRLCEARHSKKQNEEQGLETTDLLMRDI